MPTNDKEDPTKATIGQAPAVAEPKDPERVIKDAQRKLKEWEQNRQPDFGLRYTPPKK